MSVEDRQMAKELFNAVLWKLNRSEIPDFAKALTKLIEYLMIEKMMMEAKILKLQPKMIDFERFYLVFRIGKCKFCDNVGIAKK